MKLKLPVNTLTNTHVHTCLYRCICILNRQPEMQANKKEGVTINLTCFDIYGWNKIVISLNILQSS